MKLSIRTGITIMVLTVVILATAATAPQPVQQQEEFKPKNLKVLPKNITKAQLDTVMHNWRDALGVKCNFCHAQSHENPKKLDFASDEKKEKNIARGMYKMTAQINKKYFDKHSSSINRVKCNTCHRGAKEPKDELKVTE